MTNINSNGEANILKCPNCGYPMKEQSEYKGGTASAWEYYPVSSTGSPIVNIYPEQKIYHCTNPNCGRSLLKSE